MALVSLSSAKPYVLLKKKGGYNHSPRTPGVRAIPNLLKILISGSNFYENLNFPIRFSVEFIRKFQLLAENNSSVIFRKASEWGIEKAEIKLKKTITLYLKFLELELSYGIEFPGSGVGIELWNWIPGYQSWNWIAELNWLIFQSWNWNLNLNG